MSSVLKITEAVSIAFHAMIYLTLNQDRPVRVKEIAENFDISENHLSKVMQRLAKANLVYSVKGPNGGFKLVKDCQDVTFLNIFEAIDGSLPQGDCLFEKQFCENKMCIMGDLVKKVNAEVREYFQNKRLSDFL